MANVAASDSKWKDTVMNIFNEKEHSSFALQPPGKIEKLSKELSLPLHRLASRLCVVCSYFFQGTIATYEIRHKRATFHSSLSSLRNSIQSGCPFCEELSHSLDESCEMLDLSIPKNDSWTISCGVYRVSGFAMREVELVFMIIDKSGFALHNNMRIVSKSMNFSPVEAQRGYPGPRLLNGITGITTSKSETSMGIIRSWYNQCTCRKWKAESRSLPTRLIKICRPGEGLSDVSAKLCETRHLPIRTTRYITLSHRWPEGNFLKLQKGSQRAFEQGIPAEDLLQVFQDAIYIATQLDIQYIWIDSLCIIQDSPEDWAYEAASMGQVYQYGELNVAATGYLTGASSLFSARKAVPSDHFPVYFDGGIDHHGTGIIQVKGFYIQKPAHFLDVMKNAPLNSRGWVAQERALSPAILHYTPREIWWECSHMIASESFPHGHADWRVDPGDLGDITRIQSLQKGDRQSIHSYWRRFISLYSGTELTYEKDRFPAIIGIARILSVLADDNLLAGFWQGDIARSLVWKFERMTKPLSAQIAPSWSWAGMPGKIGGPGFSGTSPAMQLKSVDIRVLSDIDGFKSDLQFQSLGKSGVRALAIRGPLRRLPRDLHVVSDEWKYRVAYVDVRCDKEEIIIAGLEGKDVPNEHAWRMGSSTHLLPLVNERQSVFGILLQQVIAAKDPNTFRRSGSVHFSFNMDAEARDEYFGILERDGEYQPSSRFMEYGVQDIVLI